MVSGMGIEPMTKGLKVPCSTSELPALYNVNPFPNEQVSVTHAALR